MKSKEELIEIVEQGWANANAGQSQLNPGILSIPGMSGHKTRHLLNNIIPAVGGRYLEVGVWKGSTFCSALNNQSTITSAAAIDNWSEFGGPRGDFIHYLQQAVDLERTKVQLLDKDFRQVTASDLLIDKLGPFQTYLFDGPHKRIDQKEGITLYLPFLTDTFVLFVDDWNWTEDVEWGTRDAIAEAGLTVHKEWVAKTPNNIDHDHLGWWNGYWIAVVSKAEASKAE